MKTIIAAVLFSVFAFAAQAQDNRYFNNQYGSGSSKGDALASAMMRLPFGAKIEKVNLNGYSVRQHIKGVGYVQTSGNYKATIIYSTR
jgi:hypothetical protein